MPDNIWNKYEALSFVLIPLMLVVSVIAFVVVVALVQFLMSLWNR